MPDDETKGARRSKDEDELLAKLEAWLAGQAETPTVAEVMATGDHELLAAYILKVFRAATAQAVADRLAHHARSSFGYDPTECGTAAYRVFIGIADAWRLSAKERTVILGLDDTGISAMDSIPSHELPPQILERLSILLDIFHAINTLLPIEERADAWMGKPNRAPLFGGGSAIDLMLSEGLAGMRNLRSYLEDQVSASRPR